jgi:transcriptional regulator with XRE-family HTH domain
VRGLTQAQLAARAGTSQATLSAYERGLKSPSLKVAARIIAATGHDLNLRVHTDWVEHHPPGIVPFWGPSMLWSVGPPDSSYAGFVHLSRASLKEK